MLLQPVTEPRASGCRRWCAAEAQRAFAVRTETATGVGVVTFCSLQQWCLWGVLHGIAASAKSLEVLGKIPPGHFASNSGSKLDLARALSPIASLSSECTAHNRADLSCAASSRARSLLTPSIFRQDAAANARNRTDCPRYAANAMSRMGCPQWPRAGSYHLE